MRVAFDGLILLSPQTGIARYARELSTELARISSLELFFFFLTGWGRTPPADGSSAIGPLKRLVKAVIPRPYETLARLRQLAFDQHIRRHKFDVYHAPSFLPLRFSGPTVITVHDLSHIRYPETQPSLRVRQLDRRLPHALRDAALVLTGSEAVREEIVETFSVPAGKVVHTRFGVSTRFRPHTESEAMPVLHRFGLAYRRYLLCVGTLEPRKNLLTVLEAYARLDGRFQREVPLVIAGMQGWRMEHLSGRLAAMARLGTVRMLGFVSDHDLAALYAGASTLIFASLYEGFGFPILEAMASRTPVITSNRGSMKELSGGFCRLVDPLNVEQLSIELLAAVERAAEAEAQLENALRWASGFSWDRCAMETAAAYRLALGKPTGALS